MNPITTRSTHALLATALLFLSPSLLHADDQKAPPTEPAKPAAGDDTLRGPRVPREGFENDRGFAGRGGAAQGRSRPMVELRVYGAAIDELKLEGETKTKVDGIRADFMKRVEEFEKKAQEERKAMAEARRNAPADQPPSEELRKKMQELEAKRPKVEELKNSISAALTPEQNEQLKANFDAGMKKYREEMAKRAEEARKNGGAGEGKDKDKDGDAPMAPRGRGRGRGGDGAPPKGQDQGGGKPE